MPPRILTPWLFQPLQLLSLPRVWEGLEGKAECMPLTSSARSWGITSSARSWGVSSSTFLSRESAPASRSVDEMLLRPRPAARCKGVHPLSIRASTRAPAWSRNCTRLRSWVSTARCSAVFPLVPSWRERRMSSKALKGKHAGSGPRIRCVPPLLTLGVDLRQG